MHNRMAELQPFGRFQMLLRGAADSLPVEIKMGGWH
jgi:hypothetical protein